MRASDFLDSICISELNFAHLYIAAASEYPMNNRGRGHHGFLYTVTGSETYHFNDFDITAVPGSVLYLPKGEKYRITVSGEESRVITLDFEIANEPSRPFLVKFPEPSAVRSCFYKLENEWNKRGVAYMPECKSLLYKIVGLTSRQLSSFLPSEKFARIEAGVEYLHKNYLKNDFRLEDAAEISGISTRYFEKLFREKYGAAPKEYVISLKIERAKELLLNEKVLIKDIAIMLGYSDIYHFGKLFSAKTGYTPSEYRNK